MKGYAKFSNKIAYSLHNAGLIDSSENTAKDLMTDDGYFNFLFIA